MYIAYVSLLSTSRLFTNSSGKLKDAMHHACRHEVSGWWWWWIKVAVADSEAPERFKTPYFFPRDERSIGRSEARAWKARFFREIRRGRLPSAAVPPSRGQHFHSEHKISRPPRCNPHHIQHTHTSTRTATKTTTTTTTTTITITTSITTTTTACTTTAHQIYCHFSPPPATARSPAHH